MSPGVGTKLVVAVLVIAGGARGGHERGWRFESMDRKATIHNHNGRSRALIHRLFSGRFMEGNGRLSGGGLGSAPLKH